MYTGITQGLFPINGLSVGEHSLSFYVSLNEHLIKELSIGDSVSLDGACHTVEKIDGYKVFFTSGAETLKKTTLKHLQNGQRVLIERSAKIGQEIGGHLMSGHIYGVGHIAGIKSVGANLWLAIQVNQAMLPYIFEKGFIGVNGCSLTINRVDLSGGTFELNLIPQTLRVTNFAEKKIGDEVNIELDAQTVTIVETVQRVLKASTNKTVD